MSTLWEKIVSWVKKRLDKNTPVGVVKWIIGLKKDVAAKKVSEKNLQDVLNRRDFKPGNDKTGSMTGAPFNRKLFKKVK
jgi:hypothetical protein